MRSIFPWTAQSIFAINCPPYRFTDNIPSILVLLVILERYISVLVKLFSPGSTGVQLGKHGTRKTEAKFFTTDTTSTSRMNEVLQSNVLQSSIVKVIRANNSIFYPNILRQSFSSLILLKQSINNKEYFGIKD